MEEFILVGRRLKGLREELSQGEFAEKIDVSLRTYQRYESGERVPPPDVLSRIAGLFDTSIDWILTGELTPEQALIIAWVKQTESNKDIRKYLEQIGSKSPLYSVFLKIEKIFSRGEKAKIEAIKAILVALEFDKDEVKALDAVKALISVFESKF